MNTTLVESRTSITPDAQPDTTIHPASTFGAGATGLKIKTILVPLDFSKSSLQALGFAVSFARKFESVIHLVHVQHPDGACEIPGAGHLMGECASSVAFVTERLAQAQREQMTTLWPQNTHVRTGRAYDEICKLAKEIGADLIVLSTRGHSGFKHLLLGSTTERVVRTSSCPVLVVRQQKRKRRLLFGPVTQKPEFAIRNILVPVDFSTCAMAGVLQAASLARKFAASIRLLHVVYPAFPDVLDRVSANIGGHGGQTARRNAELDMEAVKKLDSLHGLKCETEVRSGDVVEEICGEASRPDVDLLVASTHGRTGFRHMFIGSVAEQIVRYSKCPVLIVPSLLADSASALPHA